MNNKIMLILTLVCSILAAKCTALSDSQPPDTDDFIPIKTITPTLAWSHTITDGQINSALIEGRLAYLDIWMDGAPMRIEAYDLHTKQIRWVTFATTDAYLLSGDGKLFLLNQDKGALSAISLKDSKAVWHIPLPERGYEYELAFGDNLLFFGVGGKIYAISAADGRITWQQSLPSSFRINQAWLGKSNVYREYDALSHHDGMLYIRSCGPVQDQVIECQLLALDAFDGQERWRFMFSIPAPEESPPWLAASQPVFEDERLFFGDWTGQIYLMHKDTGEVIWQDSAEFPIARPLLRGKRVYLPARDSLLCLNSETGERLWSTPLSGLRIASPIRAMEDIILFIVDHWRGRQTELVLINARTGELTGGMEIPRVEECMGCVTALEVESDRLYMMQQQTIVAINLLTLPER